jgi:hypothetical protein
VLQPRLASTSRSERFTSASQGASLGAPWQRRLAARQAQQALAEARVRVEELLLRDAGLLPK